MKVAIDGLSYFLNKGEVGEYTKGLINNIRPLENDKIYLIKDKEILNENTAQSKLKVTNLFINRINNEFRAIDDFINNSKIEIYHDTNNGFSLQKEYKYNCNIITTIHSFIPFQYENFYNEKYLRKYFSSLQIWDRCSDVILTPSSYIEDQLYLNLGISKDKIVTIPPKVNKIFTKTNNYVSRIYLKSKYNFSGDFILFSGDLHKRKNLEMFLDVFKKVSYGLPHIYFVILCNVDEINFKYYEELKMLVEGLALETRVLFITTYNQIDKLHFYNTCKVVIDFSLYEGLAISLLEAKAVGAKIICSDIQTFREVLQNYPLYLNLELPFIEEILEDYLSCEITERTFDNDFGVEKNYGAEKTLYGLYEKILE